MKTLLLVSFLLFISISFISCRTVVLKTWYHGKECIDEEVTDYQIMYLGYCHNGEKVEAIAIDRVRWTASDFSTDKCDVLPLRLNYTAKVGECVIVKPDGYQLSYDFKFIEEDSIKKFAAIETYYYKNNEANPQCTPDQLNTRWLNKPCQHTREGYVKYYCTAPWQTMIKQYCSDSECKQCFNEQRLKKSECQTYDLMKKERMTQVCDLLIPV